LKNMDVNELFKKIYYNRKRVKGEVYERIFSF